ncbi:MAG: DNA primase [Deltaproteobacteria bacterium]|nr:DNA primase [Deltaproteobacteria bacterium]
METFEEAIAEIKKRSDLGAIVGRHVQLKRTGRTLVGLCPFHAEKTPSFNVNPNEGFFKCFGCGVGGDVFTFLEMHTGQSFIDIAKSLAIDTGHALPDDGRSPEQKKRFLRNKELSQILESAQTFFRQRLRMPEGEAALRYCKEIRGLSDDEIDHFGVGYGGSGADNDLYDFLKVQNYEDEDILDTGLYARGRQSPYPFYRHRVTFPIRKKNGSLATFGGRALGDKGPKYVNGSQSPIYDKSRDFYGLFEAMPALKRKRPAVLVEGYFDVIALFKAGHESALSACGTALTPRHVEGLSQVTEQVVLCLDADAAGQKGMEKALVRLLIGGLSVSQAVLLEKDPDVYIQQGRAKDLSLLLDGAEDALDIRIQLAVAQSVGSVRARLTAVESLLPFLAAPRRDFVRKQYLVKAEKWLNIDLDDLEKEVADRGQQAITALLGGAKSQYRPASKAASSPQQMQRQQAQRRRELPEKVPSQPLQQDASEREPSRSGQKLGQKQGRQEAGHVEHNSSSANLQSSQTTSTNARPPQDAPKESYAPKGNENGGAQQFDDGDSLSYEAIQPQAPVFHMPQRRRPRPEPDWTERDRGLLRALMCFPQLVSQAAILGDTLANRDLAIFIRGLDEAFVARPQTIAFQLLQQVQIRGRAIPAVFQEVYTHRGTEDGSDFMSLETAQHWVNAHVQTLDTDALQNALGEVQRSMQNARERDDNDAWRRLQVHQRQLIDLMGLQKMEDDAGDPEEASPTKVADELPSATAGTDSTLLLPPIETPVGLAIEKAEGDGTAPVEMTPGVGENWTEDLDDDDDAFDF